MLFVGITGGVGAGKSEILNYLARHHGTRVMLADEIAHELMEPERCVLKSWQSYLKKKIFFRKMGILTARNWHL